MYLSGVTTGKHHGRSPEKSVLLEIHQLNGNTFEISVEFQEDSFKNL
jgi:hypothetical protein